MQRCLRPAKHLFLLGYYVARIPLCYCLLIEVSQQDEEHQGRAKSKGKMLEMEKNNGFMCFLLVG